jgi:hypothetical protein
MYHPTLRGLDSHTMMLSNQGLTYQSNMETLAASLYLSVHSLRQEDYDDRDAASAGEIYAILVSKSTVYVVQSSQ